jgi:hypothetical protein
MEGSQHLDNLNKEHLKSDGEELRGQSTVKTKKIKCQAFLEWSSYLLFFKKKRKEKGKNG